jgi:hypothetical protein
METAAVGQGNGDADEPACALGLDAGAAKGLRNRIILPIMRLRGF